MSLQKYAIIDLHLHLDGSLSAAAILDVARRETIPLPATNEKDLLPYLQVPENCQSLNEYLEKFYLPNLVLQTKEGLEECTLDLLERLANDGLKYVEIRMAPQLSCGKGLKQKEVVKTLIKSCKNGRKYGIFSNLILCMMRGEDTKRKNIETIKVAKKYLNKGVVAIDLAGAEALFPNKLFDEEFKLINKHNIPFTIHCGEAAGYESVESALQYNPKRIGHGIHSAQSRTTLEHLKDKNVFLEICPKSNLDTKAIKSYDELPIRTFIKKGIKVTINTDDMTVSNTSLKNEFETLEKLGFKPKEAREFAKNAIEASFANDEIKQYLKDSLKKIR